MIAINQSMSESASASAAPAAGVPASASRARAPGVVPATLAPLALGALMVATSLAVQWAGVHRPEAASWLSKQCLFDENAWQTEKAYHTLVTHALLHDDGAALLYFLGGLVVFGSVVARNIGIWRTWFIFAFSVAMSVAVWRFILTPFGDRVLVDLVGRAFRFLAERFDPGIALTCLGLYQEAYVEVTQFRGPVAGAAGGVAGLMAFAVFRRTLYATGVQVKFLAVLAIAGYIAIGAGYVWPTFVSAPFPTILWVGGAVGGWIACVPDIAFAQLLPSFRCAWNEPGKQS